MNTYIKDGFVSFCATLGITIPTGLLDNIVALLIVAAVTGIVVPLIRYLGSCIIYNIKGYTEEKKQELQNKLDEDIDEIVDEIKKMGGEENDD